MKRYLAFFGSNYYPSGGMRDFIGDFDEEIECRIAIHKEILKDFNSDVFNVEEHIKYEWSMSWAHIYDTKEQKIVWTK